MSPNLTVYVKNISAETDDKEIKDFFSFCGKITDIKVTPVEKTKEATVVFEKETAARTAQLLNNTKLGPNQISVTHEGVGEDHGPTSNAERDSDEITQEEKPRSRIFAEYLAHGYVVGDVALQRAIELDHKHGVSNRFVNTLQGLDSKYHATDRAKTADQSYGITQKAQGIFGGLSSYFEKATNTPTGKKLVNFYTQGSQQVQDIHAEARRLADLKKDEHGGSAYKASGLERVFGKEKEKSATGNDGASEFKPYSTETGNQTCGCKGEGKVCGCEKDKCVCNSCSKSEKNNQTCGCSGNAGECSCEEDKCVCDSCAKSKKTNQTCGCSGNAGECSCGEGKCVCDSCAKSKKTDQTCGCSGNAGECSCEEGKCVCNSCAKSKKTGQTCGCSGNAGQCSCEKSKCACGNGGSCAK